jgi:hypothetical protein
MTGAGPVKSAEPDGEKGLEAALALGRRAVSRRGGSTTFYRTFTAEPSWASVVGYTPAGPKIAVFWRGIVSGNSREGVERYETTFEVGLGP